jgi:hypothetical protein
MNQLQSSVFFFLIFVSSRQRTLHMNVELGFEFMGFPFTNGTLIFLLCVTLELVNLCSLMRVQQIRKDSILHVF